MAEYPTPPGQAPAPAADSASRGESRFSRWVNRLRDLEQKKAPWLPVYQALAEMYLNRKADFTRSINPGEFMMNDIFDNTPQLAAFKFASICMSLLWPDAARTFNIVPKPFLRGNAGVEAYFRAKSARMHESMDKPEAGLSLALTEYFLELGIFGLSGVAALEGKDDENDGPTCFESWDVKSMFIAENSRGYIDTIFLKSERTVRQIYQEYVENAKPGDKVSSRVLEFYSKGKYDEKIETVKVCEPRTPVPGKKGVLAMKWASIHLDLTNRVIMREGGFEELPAAVSRLFKSSSETQGRSCGMVGLPAATNLNSLRQDLIEASEKNLKPPLVVLDDGRLGGTVIDTSPDGLVVVNTSGRPPGEKPISPLYTVGEMQGAKDEKEALVAEVMQAFYLDTLIDLGGDRPMMTAYETAVRNRIRGESAGSLFARQILEFFIPLIKRVYNMHYRRGYFGDFVDTDRNGTGAVQRRKWYALTGKDLMEVPEVVRKARAAGLEIFDIEFISPAQRFMQAEKLQGIMTTLDTMIAVGQVRPDILDNIDLDQIARDIYKYAGCPVGSLRTIDDLKEVRASMAKQQNTGAALEAGKTLADITQKTASARSLMGTMGNPAARG
jgi:hypothetical protein